MSIATFYLCSIYIARDTLLAISKRRCVQVYTVPFIIAVNISPPTYPFYLVTRIFEASSASFSPN